jgi:hypothetical protein
MVAAAPAMAPTASRIANPGSEVLGRPTPLA